METSMTAVIYISIHRILGVSVLPFSLLPFFWPNKSQSLLLFDTFEMFQVNCFIFGCLLKGSHSTEIARFLFRFFIIAT